MTIPALPADRRYTDGHLWLKTNPDGSVDVGATFEGQLQLGDMVYVEFPVIGQDIMPIEVLATLESVKAASDMYVPLTGKVMAINGALKANPELLNSAPYETWVARLTTTKIDDTKLMSAEQYAKMIGQ
jgi:glycine cleavage system H protein